MWRIIYLVASVGTRRPIIIKYTDRQTLREPHKPLKLCQFDEGYVFVVGWPVSRDESFDESKNSIFFDNLAIVFNIKYEFLN